MLDRIDLIVRDYPAIERIKAIEEEIVPVVIPQRKGDPIVFDTDERPMDTTIEKMQKLAPVFKKDGTVTADRLVVTNSNSRLYFTMGSTSPWARL